MQPLDTAWLLTHLRCPQCEAPALAVDASVLVCRTCGRHYPVVAGICNFVLPDQLGPTAQQEIRAINCHLHDPVKRQHLMHRDQNGLLAAHFLRRSVRMAARYLAPYATAGQALCALGCGGGFDLLTLAQFVRFKRIVAGDISTAATACIGENLAAQDGRLGLLACEFQRCPVRRSPDVVGFVFEALHHTADVHQTIEQLLAQNFDQLVFVEPTRNWLTDLLAKWSLTMNVEYSGLTPDWIHLRKVRAIAQRMGYHMAATTWWPCPDNLVPRWIKCSTRLTRGFCRLVDIGSWLTAPFHFGAMSAVHLWK